MNYKCRQEMIAEGQTEIPRSCPKCGLGPCNQKTQPMKFTIITKATIDAKTINKMLIAAIEKETEREVDTISFNISTQYDMRNEPYGSIVTGLEVVFK